MRINVNSVIAWLLVTIALFLVACARADLESPELGYEGVVGVVLTPHNRWAYHVMADLVGIGLRDIARKNSNRLFLNALFPESHGKKLFLGPIPAGTYTISEFGFRISGEHTHWVEVEEGELRFSVLPDTVTNLGEMVFLAEREVARSRLSIFRLANTADIGMYIRRHPTLRDVELKDVRGWDDPSQGVVAQERQLRRTASVVGYPVATESGVNLMPTMLGDFVVRTESGEWGRVRGPGRGYISRIRSLDDGSLLVAGDSGMHLGNVSDASFWQAVAIDPSMDSVLDANIVGDRLFALVEKRHKTVTNGESLVPQRRLKASASVSLVSMPWPSLNSISVWQEHSIPTDTDLLGDAVMTESLALLPLGGADYAWQSLRQQSSEGVLHDIDRLHTQGRYLFIKSSRAMTWTYVIGDDIEERRDLTGVRVLQPPVALSDGELLIYGRIVGGREVSPIGYYLSSDGGSTWSHWSDRPTDCNRPRLMYRLDRELFQFCRNGDLYLSDIDEPNWTRGQRGLVEWWDDFPIGNGEVGL